MENCLELLTLIFSGITAGSVLIAIIQLFITLKMNRRKHKQSSAERVINLHEKFTHDDSCRKLFYDIEYNHFIYKDIHDSPEEKALDTLLDYLSYVCRLYKQNLIEKEDLMFFEYEILKVYRNNEIQKYFAFLKPWCKANKLVFKYQAFEEIGNQLNVQSLKK